jgi:hypothetical protein
LISTNGGFPGDKNKSLIFEEVCSIAASKAGVESGAGERAAAAAVPAEELDAGVPLEAISMKDIWRW